MFNSFSQFGLTFFQVRGVGKASNTGALSEYDEYVPMVDKAVDVGWEKKMSQPNPSVARG